MEEVIKLEAAVTELLIFIYRHTAGCPCRGGVLVGGATAEAGGYRRRRTVKYGDESGGRERNFSLQLSMSQLALQHHILQLFVCEGSSLSHAGGDGGARKVSLMSLLQPTGRAILYGE